MSPKERKELVGYLKKETDRLDKAIHKAHEIECLGRVVNYEQLRDAFLHTLNKLLTEKKGLLFLLTVGMLLFPSMKGQIKKPEQEKDRILVGKIFVIEISEKPPKETKPFQYQLAFKGGRLHPKPIKLGSKQDSLPAGFSSGDYSRTVDSSPPDTTIIFSSLSKKSSGETLLWLGYVTGNTIQGAVHWSVAKKKYKLYSFSGKLKYVNSNKGKL